MNRLRSAMVLSLMMLGCMVATPAFAQDDGTMTFGEEEAAEVDEGGGDDGGTMTFGEEEAAEAEQTGKPVVGIVAVPSDTMDASQRSQLQQQLAKSLQPVTDIRLETGPAVLDSLQQNTVATCVTEPLCLADVGESAGVDRIVMARVKKNESGFQLDIDYFDVADRLFMKYNSAKNLGTFKAVIGAVQPTINQVFEIRTEEEGPNFADEDTGKARTIIAISSAVLSAGALTGGILFGMQASDAEDELNSFEKNDNGVYKELTQQQAQSMLDDAQSKAATANVFYGLSGAFAVASGVLFFIKPDSQGAETRESAKLMQRIDLKPVFTRDGGAGVSAGFDF